MKQHKIFRVTALLVLCLSLLFSLSVTASAEEAEAVTEIVTELPVTASPTAPAPKGEEATDSTLSREIAAWLKGNLAELLSAASLLLMLALSLLFKKGVLPKLLSLCEALFSKGQQTLSSLGDYQAAGEERLNALLSKGKEVLSSVEKVTEKEEVLSSALADNEQTRALFSSLLSRQSTLLFELLMAANLPQYQKDRVAKAYFESEESLAALKGGEMPQGSEGE